MTELCFRGGSDYIRFFTRSLAKAQILFEDQGARWRKGNKYLEYMNFFCRRARESSIGQGMGVMQVALETSTQIA